MDFHDRSSARPNRVGVIAEMGAIGSPDLAQAASGARHDVWDTKCAADLDQLTAGNDNFFAQRERVQDEIDSGSVVVDDAARLSAGQPAQPSLRMLVTLTSGSPGQVVLEVYRLCHGCGRRFCGGLGQQCAAKIGV